MGFNYRKSVNLGPFRINASKSGVGWSVGTRGLRTGVSSSGRRYTTFSLPGTGLSYTTRSKSGTGQGCLLVLAALGGGVVLFLIALL